jgi:hypothetical protein
MVPAMSTRLGWHYTAKQTRLQVAVVCAWREYTHALRMLYAVLRLDMGIRISSA